MKFLKNFIKPKLPVKVLKLLCRENVARLSAYQHQGYWRNLFFSLYYLPQTNRNVYMGAVYTGYQQSLINFKKTTVYEKLNSLKGNFCLIL